MVLMVHRQLLLQMQHGKSLLILKEILMVKDVHNQVIQLIHLMLIPILHNINILVGIIIKHKHHKHQLINIITEQIHRLVKQMHLLIKQQLVTIISRPIRHLRPIIIVNNKKKKEHELLTYCTVCLPPHYPFFHNTCVRVCVCMFTWFSISYICVMQRYYLKKKLFFVLFFSCLSSIILSDIFDVDLFSLFFFLMSFKQRSCFCYCYTGFLDIY